MGTVLEGFDAKSYLETVLPALLAQGSKLPPPKDEIQIAVILPDAPASGVTLCIDRETVSTRPGVSDSPDLSIVLLAGDLERLLERPTEARRAFQSRRIQVAGDLALLGWLARRLRA
jgi:hypothetical protein